MTARNDTLVTKSLLDGPATLAQLRAHTGLKRRSAWGAVGRLLRSGRIAVAEDNTGRRWYRAR